MLSEVVDIRLTNDEMLVTASFVFKNEGKAANVQMGFPDEVYDVDGLKRGISKMRSTVDGQPLLVSYRPRPAPGVLRGAWVKMVPFRAGQTRRVVATYTASHGEIEGLSYDIYVLQTGATWKGPIGHGTVTVDWSGLQHCGHPKLWAEEKPLYLGRPLKVTMLGSKRARFEFRNWKPTFDIGMRWHDADLR
jgi:hypothetical protein